ncbi:MAG: glutathione S-transferase N-terminal domain-containing protein [Pseudomonadales bacterium]|nr:glutathione S-transferase N-terminal domain-containing protein [Pseudomonadales bacterium]
MSSPVWFPARWQPTMPEEIQLYSMATPNGQKVGIALEEMGLSYDAHLIDITRNDQLDPDYLKISPNGKIPAILDPKGPEGQPVLLMESVAILIYLADMSGTLLPQNYLARMDHLQWLIFQTAHIGPMFGQFGHFYKFARDKTSDDYAMIRYTNETKRLLNVLDVRLQGREHIMDDYSIVDIAIMPWVECLAGFYQASDHLEMDSFANVQAWRQRVTSRPAYIRGRDVCRRG